MRIETALNINQIETKLMETNFTNKQPLKNELCCQDLQPCTVRSIRAAALGHP